MYKRQLASCVVAILVLAAASASADMSKDVQKAFKGDIIISDSALPADGEGKKAIADIKKARVKAVKHVMDDGVPTWTFHYTAFLKAPPKTSALSFDFYTDEKKSLYVADKRFTGIDPNLKILSGVMTISEDDNVNKGRTYQVRLTGKIGKREIVFATTKLSFK